MGEKAKFSSIHVRPYAPNLGAVVTGIRLSEGVTAEQFVDIHRAFLLYQVLFFQDQHEISPDMHVAFGRMFGKLHAHPAAPMMKGRPEIFEIRADANSKIANGEFWHSDVSCDERPPMATLLQIHEIPPDGGGDTLFSNMTAAYHQLSHRFKLLLEDLTATHESSHIYLGRYADRGRADSEISCPVASHPVVRTHPDTGRKTLFVNRTFTTRINELTESESKMLLQLLFDHCEKIDYQIRYRWSVNDLVIWDNRCCMHRAVWDYWPATRCGRRVTVSGDRPR